MCEPGPDGCLLQPLDQRTRPRREIRILRVAGLIGAAVGEELIERALGVAREKERQPHVWRRHAVENHRPDVRFMLAQVDERGSRPIRAAVDVDLVVAEECADLVEIVHRDRRRVQTQVGVFAEPFQAGFEANDALLVALIDLAQRVAVGAALERMRLAGTALVDEDDVAGGLDAAEQFANATRHLRGALARAAGEEEQRIGLSVVAE